MSPISLEDLLRFERGELDDAAAERVRDELKHDAEASLSLDWLQALRDGAPGMDASGGPKSPGTKEPPGAQKPHEALAPASFGEIAHLAAGSLGPDEAVRVRGKLLVTPDGYELLESALEEVAAMGQLQVDTSLESQPPILPGPRPHASQSSSHSAPHRGIPRAAFALAAAVFVAAGIWLWQQPAPSVAPPTVQSVATLAEKASMHVPRLRAGTFEAGLDAYEAKDFSKAAALLRSATEEDQDAGTIWLYLGSAELLIGNLNQAADALEVARAKCEPSFQVEATWQLAQTRLAQNLPDKARALLLELAGTRRSKDAEEKLEALNHQLEAKSEAAK